MSSALLQPLLEKQAPASDHSVRLVDGGRQQQGILHTPTERDHGTALSNRSEQTLQHAGGCACTLACHQHYHPKRQGGGSPTPVFVHINSSLAQRLVSLTSKPINTLQHQAVCTQTAHPFLTGPVQPTCTTPTKPPLTMTCRSRVRTQGTHTAEGPCTYPMYITASPHCLHQSHI